MSDTKIKFKRPTQMVVAVYKRISSVSSRDTTEKCFTFVSPVTNTKGKKKNGYVGVASLCLRCYLTHFIQQRTDMHQSRDSWKTWASKGPRAILSSLISIKGERRHSCEKLYAQFRLPLLIWRCRPTISINSDQFEVSGKSSPGNPLYP